MSQASDSAYKYLPTEWVCATFVSLFGLSTLLHLAQGVRSKRWYMLGTYVLGGIGEILGWSGRLWSSKNISITTPFLIQISTTILSPTFLVAANFIIFGSIINRSGRQYSRLTPAAFGYIFITIDIVALVLQAVGGGMASAAGDTPGGDPQIGGRVMLVGIVIQLAEILVYIGLATEFYLNFYKGKIVRPQSNTAVLSPPMQTQDSKNSEGSETTDKPLTRPSDAHEPSSALEKGVESPMKAMGAQEKLMSLGITLSTLFILIRSIYRTAELSQGWGGPIISTEIWFNIFDGAMIVLAMYTLNVLHPGYLL